MEDWEKIESSLCYYDSRNPYGRRSEEEIKPEDCHCDNCFYGRTELAEEILRLRELLKNI